MDKFVCLCSNELNCTRDDIIFFFQLLFLKEGKRTVSDGVVGKEIIISPPNHHHSEMKHEKPWLEGRGDLLTGMVKIPKKKIIN